MNQQIQQRDGYSQLAIDLLAKAKRSGATEADIMIADGETFSVQVRLGVVDRLTKAREKHLGLRVFVGKRSASTSTSDFSADSLNQLAAETCILAKAVVEDHGVRLAGGGSDGGREAGFGSPRSHPTEYGTADRIGQTCRGCRHVYGRARDEF